MISVTYFTQYHFEMGSENTLRSGATLKKEEKWHQVVSTFEGYQKVAPTDATFDFAGATFGIVWCHFLIPFESNDYLVPFHFLFQSGTG